MVGALHLIKADGDIDIAAAIRMRAGNARVEQHRPITRPVGWRLLANKIGANDSR